MGELIGEIFWGLLRVITKAIGVVFIKVFTLTSTSLIDLYSDESKNILSYSIGTLVIIALIALLIYYTNL